MKLLLFSAAVLLFFSSCATPGRIVEEIPPLDAVTVKQLEEKVSSDELVFEAIQDISAIRNLESTIPPEKLDELYKKALDTVTLQFAEAITEKNYRDAWKIYSSAEVLGIEDRFPEWNSDKRRLKEAIFYL